MKPTMAMPMILPIINWKGLTELMSTSTTRSATPACVTLRLQASHRSTARGAIDLAPVAVAAHQRWRTAARTQKASRRLVAHVYPGELPRVCWTGSSTGATLALHPLSHDTV